MWDDDPDAFAAAHHISKREAKRFQSTAEHLIARAEGGKATAGNIAAACAFCNHTRHRAKNPKSPELFEAHVRRRIAHGKWHGARLLALMKAGASNALNA
jgi:hypothetical protein